MDDEGRLAHLHARISDVLQQLPGAVALFSFGSRTTPDADQYADIDMQVVSADLAAARAVWPTILERVGPIEIAWQIEPQADTTAYAILFVQESPYHKLDVGISDPAEAARLFAGDTHRVEWRQGLDHRRPTTDDRPIRTDAYMPSHGSVGHTLVGELMSAIRYVKARKRGHHLTCWRFARSKVDVFIKLLDEQAGGWMTEKASWTTWDYKALDKRLGEEGDRVHAMLDWSTHAAMDRGVWRLTEEITHLLQEKAQHRGEHIPAATVVRHLSFIQSELGVALRA